MSQDDSTPNGGGGGVESWQDDLTQKENRGGVESSWDDSTPREDRGPRGDKTLVSPTASRSRQEENGQGRGGGDKNPPTTRKTKEQPTDGGDGAAPRGKMAMEDAEKETEEGTGGAGHPPAYFTRTAASITESDARQRHEYGKEATAALVGGQYRAGPAPEEDDHRATGNGGNTQRKEGGTKPTGERERIGQRPTEIRRRGAPLNGRARLMRAADEEGEGRGGTPHPAARAHGAQRVSRGGTPRGPSRDPPTRRTP